MDNGGAQGKMNAKEFTEAINRATEPVYEPEKPVVDTNEATPAPDMPEANQTQIGREAIYSAGDTGGMAAEQANLERATQELARDQEELVDAERFVGDESQLEIADHLREDEEDLLNEIGQGSPYVGKIMGQNQTEIANDVMAKVSEITKPKEFHPAEVANVRRMGMHAILRTYERTLGERNIPWGDVNERAA